MSPSQRRQLAGSNDELIDPGFLSDLFDVKVEVQEVARNIDHAGNAGSEFTAVQTDAGNFVLKTMSIESDWQMYATSDVRCRSLRLWEFGVLDAVHPHLEHHVVAGAESDTGQALLMRDVSGTFEPPLDDRPELLFRFLDGLTGMHAAFWEESALLDPELGLGNPAMLLNLASRSFNEDHSGDQWGILPGWCLKGWGRLDGARRDHVRPPRSYSRTQSVVGCAGPIPPNSRPRRLLLPQSGLQRRRSASGIRLATIHEQPHDDRCGPPPERSL